MSNTKIILVQEEPRGPSQLIELPVTQNGASKIPFQDVDNLKNDVDQNVIIKALRLVTSDIAVGGVINPGPIAPNSELIKMFLVLYSEGWEKAEYIPLLVMNDEAGGLNPFRYVSTRFSDWKKVNWTKSFVQFANGQVSVGAPYTILFDCEYQKFNAQGEEIQGVSS